MPFIEYIFAGLNCNPKVFRLRFFAIVAQERYESRDSTREFEKVVKFGNTRKIETGFE